MDIPIEVYNFIQTSGSYFASDITPCTEEELKAEEKVKMVHEKPKEEPNKEEPKEKVEDEKPKRRKVRRSFKSRKNSG